MTPLDVINGARWCLAHGDNREVLPTLPNLSVAHVITDPPYSEHVHGKNMRQLRGSGGNAANDGVKRGKVGAFSLGFDALETQHRRELAEEFARLISRWVLVFSDAESVHFWREDLEAEGLPHIRQGAWVKLNCQPQLTGDRPAVGSEAVQISHRKGRKKWNGGGLPAVWAYSIATDRSGRGDRVHTTQKPLDLMLRLVELFTDPGDIVLDPFAGSGTTGVACLRLGRRFIGVERDERYAAIATERLLAEERGLSLREARAGQTTFSDLLGT